VALQFAAYSLPSYHADTDGRPGEYMRSLVDLLASAETLGFDGIWANEHHFQPWGGMLPSLPVLLAALSQRTQRVSLGTSVIVLPLHNPIEIAEQLAMVDLMSNGRLQLGVGRGSLAYDYEMLSLPLEDAQERLVDGLEIILKAWSGGRVSHESPFVRFNDLEVWPPGKQQPHPPIWISCSKQRTSFEWTGRTGYNLLTVAFPQPIERLHEMTGWYRDAGTAAGRSGDGQIGTLFHIVVGENGAKARKQAVEAFGRFRDELNSGPGHRKTGGLPPMDGEELVAEARMLAGNPQEVADALRYTQREIGFSQVILMFQLGGLSFDTARESMTLFAGEVMPKLRA
jgi:alkanesulfonate monooxygenase SsuD/methylene tetrahydromethanopterin reductase-like flavin-dependent oxidoreductase (luciferase family)